ncbi:MAG: DNA repair protein RadC [Kofleriaceae bacterium]
MTADVAADRPRERLWDRGPGQVLDHELVALVLGTGTRGRPATGVAATLLHDVGGLAALSRALPPELVRTAGVGAARAARLAAAFELGRRVLDRAAASPPTISSARDVHARVRARFAGLLQEVFVAVAVDARSGVLAELEIARGQLTGVEVHPREVFRPLIRLGAAAVVVVHNHPSGDPTPSPEDVLLTRRLREVGELVGIPVLDHLVVAGPRYQSLAEWLGTDF